MDASDGPVRSFNITTKRMEFEPEVPAGPGRVRKAEGRYLVTFVVQNTGSYPNQPFEIPIWVHGSAVRPDDVLRAAKHLLHQDLQMLAEISASFRIADDDQATVFQTE